MRKQLIDQQNPFKIKSPLILFAFAIMFLFASINCKKVNELCNGNDCFSFEDFEQAIKDRLEGNTTGYGFIIYNGQQTNNIYTSGNRRMAVDGQQQFTLTNPMHIASVSKSISAFGLMHVLDSRNDVNVDDLIHPFLPGSWQQGSNINLITFRELLTHWSGFRSTFYYEKCSHQELTDLVKNGVTLPNRSMNSYQNVNFALMRILIPHLAGTNPGTGSDAVGYANAYVQYVQDNVLATVDVFTASRDCKPEVSNPTLYYKWPDAGGTGWDAYGDLTPWCGGFGWYLSLTDLGNLISKFAHTGEIVGNNTRNDMYAGQLGIIQYSGSEGTYYWHNGGWGDGNRGLNTCYMIFPKNNVHAVLFMNSDPGPAAPQDILADSYDEAWEII